MTFLDLWDQVVTTEVIKRRFEETRLEAGGGEDFSLDGEDILPLKSHNGRYAKVRVHEITPVGMGYSEWILTPFGKFRPPWDKLIELQG